MGPLEVIVAPVLALASLYEIGPGEFPAGDSVYYGEEFRTRPNVVGAFGAVVGLSVAIGISDFLPVAEDGAFSSQLWRRNCCCRV